jgi:hypothetical protein
MFNQIPLISNWQYPPALPLPGQRVLARCIDHDGTVTQATSMTPIHADGSHLMRGKSIYLPLHSWTPIEADYE